jgi:hypothetical protein
LTKKLLIAVIGIVLVGCEKEAPEPETQRAEVVTTGATVNCTTLADCQTKVNSANNGDTITVTQSSTWTDTLDINKNISLMFASGVTITDGVDKAAADPSLISLNFPSTTTLMRVSGLKLNAGSGGTSTGSRGIISVSGVSTVPNLRIDNCDFPSPRMRPIVFFGSVWGVIDHCAFTHGPWVGGINIRHATWKGVGDYGDNSWADSSNWGSEQAIFIEDCTFNSFGGSTFIDGDAGMRVAVRYNTINVSEAGNHGTETSQRWRSGRTFEMYKNRIVGCDTRIPNNCSGGAKESGWCLYVRGGGALFWGNYVDQMDSLVKFDLYRLWFKATPWGQADGKNGWDKNYPSVFDSGTATGSSSLTMIDTTKNWSANQWRSYSLLNKSAGTASAIGSNANNSIKYDGNPQGAAMTFSAGNSYEIRRVEVVLDSPGRGKGDMININSPAWPNEVLEPVRIWGNTLGPNFGRNNGKPIVPSPPQLVSGRDWYYSPDDAAKLTGYTPYQYPHPLVGGVPTSPTPVPSPTATSVPTSTPNVTPTPPPSPSQPPSPSPSPTPAPTSTATATPAPTATAVPSSTPITLILHEGDQLNIYVRPMPTP